MTPTTEQRLAQRFRPKSAHVMYQTWSDLLFLHWHCDPAAIQATLPAGLTVDTFNGNAYIGLVPFYMERVRPRFLPAVPWLSWFLEFNVRTYVYDASGTPGVWFYSLDCNQPIAVWTARTFFKLPYFNATMTAPPRRRGHNLADGHIDYRSYRRGTDAALASRFTYRERGEQFHATPGSLEFFLAERYILFAETAKGLASGQVHHHPYPLQHANVSNFDTHAILLDGLPPVAGPPVSALYSRGVDVAIYPLKRL